MENTNGTGITYPTLELGGKTYTVKFSRGGMLYRLSKTGTNLADLKGQKSFATLVDVLHAALFGQYQGTSEELADLLLSEGKAMAAGEAVSEALKKAFPPTQPIAEAAAVEKLPAVQ